MVPKRTLVLLLSTTLTGCTMSDTDSKKPAASTPAADLVPSGYVKSNPDSQPSLEEHLEVSLTSAGTFAKDAPVTVTFRLANTGPDPIRACKVFTPLEDRKRAALEVTDAQGASRRRSGSKQAGPMPGQGDWVTLEPGQALEAKVDLREDFDLPPGKYQVRFVGHPHVNHLKDSAPHAFVVED
jgi:hypothetical protein